MTGVLETQSDNELAALLRVLPPWIQMDVAKYDVLEEIVMDLGDELSIRVGGPEPYRYNNRRITIDDIKYVQRKVGQFKDNGRVGIPGTLHRVSRKQDDLLRLIGITVRYGRDVEGVADALAPHLEGGGSILLIGGPGKGKSTLLRGVVRHRAAKNHKQTCVCDTSGEIGGHGQEAHPCIGKARRFHVPQPSMQAMVLTQMIQNHSPIDIIVDEMGYNEDVMIAEKAARSGTKVIGTVHGETIEDVLENPMLYSLLGYPNRKEARRTTRPTFSMALEVVAKGKFLLYPNLAQAVDALLLGDRPEGVRLGAW